MNTKDHTTIIWDVGGVLHDFDQSITDSILARHCAKTTEEISAVIFGGSASGREYNQGIIEPYNLGLIDSQTFYERLKETLGLDMSFDEFATAWKAVWTTPKQSLLDFVKGLKAYPVKQGILSSTNPLHWQGLCERINIEGLISPQHSVCTYHQGAHEKKPHPKLFDIVLQKLNSTKGESGYVDDVLKYVTAAQTYGLSGGFHVDLKQPDHVARCIEEVTAYLDLQNTKPL